MTSPHPTTELVRVRRLIQSGDARQLRLRAGLSLSEMGAAVIDTAAGVDGVAPSTVLRWEVGDRKPRGAVGVAYGRALARLQRELQA